MLLRLAWAAQRSEGREVFQIARRARTQSERRRRLPLATGFRLLRLSGINRIAAQGSVAGARVARPGEDFDKSPAGENHRVRLSNLANLDNFVSLLLLGIAWRVVHGFWLPEFYIT